MCYARRQRSSWARIKLSDLLYIICFSRTNIVSELFSSFFYFFEFQSILTRFFVLTLSIIFESLSCSIFKDRFAPLPQQRSTSISHTFLFVNAFFQKNLKIFVFVAFVHEKLNLSRPLVHFYYTFSAERREKCGSTGVFAFSSLLFKENFFWFF